MQVPLHSFLKKNGILNKWLILGFILGHLSMGSIYSDCLIFNMQVYGFYVTTII